MSANNATAGIAAVAYLRKSTAGEGVVGRERQENLCRRNGKKLKS